MKMDELVAVYGEQLRADGRSENTVMQALRHGRVAATFFGEREVDSIDPQDVARFLVSAMATKTPDGGLKKATSQNAMRSSIRCIFAFAHAAGLASTNPARLVRRARTSPPPPRGLSDIDRAKLVAELDGAETWAERRDAALFNTLLGAGLRIGSAVAARVEDLELDAGELRLTTMKAGNQDTVFLSPPVVALLREWLGDRRDGWLFPASDGGQLTARQGHRRLAAIAKRAGLSRSISPHSLRHAFAMRLYASSRDLLLVSRALSHRSVASTTTYARATAERVREAIAACG